MLSHDYLSVSSLFLLVPDLDHVLRIREPVAGHNILVTHHCVLGRTEVELTVVEWFNISFLSDQTQPDVIKPEHPGVVAGVVHVHQSISGQDVSSSCNIGRPEVERILQHINKPLGPLESLRSGPGEHVTSEQLHI